MAESKDSLAEGLMKELAKRIGNDADSLQGPDKAFQLRASSILGVCIQLGLRRDFGD